ncbi:MAG: CoA transferase [Firmicutes bacterium]|nr:CoA transferase [Bacillota bacterium]
MGGARRPLDGVTVVALEQAVAAPFATRQLADLGARVVKVERPDGGDFARRYDETVQGLASYFVWLNRSKESLTLDLKHPEAALLLERLFARADVVVHNLSPGAARRLNLEAAALRARWPRLVVCTISGYGSGGPSSDRKAYDLLIQAETGLLSLTGTPQTPVKVGISVADIAAGMYAFSGILAALLERERTGEGASLEVSMLEALGEWVSHAAYYAVYSGADPERTGAHHASIAPYGPFRVGDGNAVYLAVQNEREWVRLCTEVLGRPELAEDERFRTNPRRAAHRDELAALIEESFAACSLEEVQRRLDQATIAYSRMNTVRAFWEHPQLSARGRWREVASPAGPVRAPLPPLGWGDWEPRMGPVPALGEHTDAILAELGLAPDEIRRLRAAGAV